MLVMKVKALVVLTLVLFISGCAGTAAVKRIAPGETTPESVTKPNSTFTVGEKLTLEGAWQGINIGNATATIEELMTFRGYEVYKIVVVAKTNKFLFKLFPVEDIFTSYVDSTTFTSRHYEAKRREGNYRKHLVVDYDFDKLTATYTNLKDGTVKTSTIVKDVHDPISASYFCRTIPINVGEEVKIKVNLNEKNYEITAPIVKKVSMTISDLGTFEAFLVKPYIKLDGKRQKRARTWGYISTGEKRLPLYGDVKVLEIPLVGNVTGILKKVEYIEPVKYQKDSLVPESDSDQGPFSR